jgi:histidinol dehydrogenase
VIWIRIALAESIHRARRVHADQRRIEVTTQVVPGGTVTQHWLPVDRVGLYVPGGRAVYPSQRRDEHCARADRRRPVGRGGEPPQKETGLPHPLVLAACALLDEVYAVGGAQAIAMFAYGTEESAPVDMVTRPGNI